MKTNEKYGARGWTGRDPGSAPEPFRSPEEIKRFTGYGADEADLERGYVVPVVRNDPAYDLENYKLRATEPSVPDTTKGNDLPMSADFEFRNRERVSKGFLTRPHPAVRRVFADERN